MIKVMEFKLRLLTGCRSVMPRARLETQLREKTRELKINHFSFITLRISRCQPIISLLRRSNHPLLFFQTFTLFLRPNHPQELRAKPQISERRKMPQTSHTKNPRH